MAALHVCKDSTFNSCSMGAIRGVNVLPVLPHVGFLLNLIYIQY